MPTFIMLTRLNPDAVRSPQGLEQLERDAMKRVREECPNVEWLNSYAVLGPCDYLHLHCLTSRRPLGYPRSFERLATPILKSGRQRSGTVSRSSSAPCQGRADRLQNRPRFGAGHVPRECPKVQEGGHRPPLRSPLKVFKVGGRTAYCCPQYRN